MAQMIQGRQTMRFNELAIDSKNDNDKWDIDDTRRPRLTLKHLNKIRNKRELAKAEYEDSQVVNAAMYGKPAEE
jgi:hypothetical protein